MTLPQIINPSGALNWATGWRFYSGAEEEKSVLKPNQST
jgi:hypothetical protein